MALRGGLEETASRWATYPVASNVPTAESVRTGRPVLVRRDDVDERYPSLGGFADGTGSILCLPLVVAGGRVLGAVSLSFPGRRALSEAENLFLQLLADTCAMTLDRVDAQRAARDREAKLTFLAEASAKLSSDLDYEATLTAVAEAAVPWFADWCAISLGGGRPAPDDRGGAHPPRADRAGAGAAGALPRRPQLRPGWLPGAAHRREPARARGDGRAAGRRRRGTRSTSS